MKRTAGVDVRETPIVISDSGKIRIVSLSPAFPPVRGRPTNSSDAGNVRVGSMSPAFPVMRPLVRGTPITINDAGEVRIGDHRAADTSGSDEPNVRIAPVRSR
jgi:hypothetical protein